MAIITLRIRSLLVSEVPPVDKSSLWVKIDKNRRAHILWHNGSNWTPIEGVENTYAPGPTREELNDILNLIGDLLLQFEGDIVSLKDRCTSLESREDDELNTKVQLLTQQQESLSRLIDELYTNLSVKDTEITVLKSTVTSQYLMIQSLQETCNSLSNRIQDLSNQVQTQSVTVNSHTQNISALESTIASLPTKQYVDNAVNSIDIPSIEGLATEQFVVDNINAIDYSIYLTADDISDLASKSEVDSAKEYTDTKIAALVGSAPSTLDTLEEIADALQDNDGAIEAIMSTISNKVDTVTFTPIKNKVDLISSTTVPMEVTYANDTTETFNVFKKI